MASKMSPLWNSIALSGPPPWGILGGYLGPSPLGRDPCEFGVCVAVGPFLSPLPMEPHLGPLWPSGATVSRMRAREKRDEEQNGNGRAKVAPRAHCEGLPALAMMSGVRDAWAP